MKKKTLITTLIAITSAVSLFAGTVNLAWDTYVEAGVDTIKIYAVRGTNTVFATGNTNATIIRSTSVANTSISITNLTSGPWTFVATAANTTNLLESPNSGTVWANVYPGAIINLHIAP